MIVYGFDIPMIEILLAVIIISFILLIEAIVVIIFLVKQQHKIKAQMELLHQFSGTLMEIKNVEMKMMRMLKARR